MGNWWNEVFIEQGWTFASPDPVELNDGKMVDRPAYPYDKGCRVCGTFTGEHGFSFTSRPGP